MTFFGLGKLKLPCLGTVVLGRTIGCLSGAVSPVSARGQLGAGHFTDMPWFDLPDSPIHKLILQLIQFGHRNEMIFPRPHGRIGVPELGLRPRPSQTVKWEDFPLAVILTCLKYC